MRVFYSRLRAEFAEVYIFEAIINGNESNVVEYSHRTLNFAQILTFRYIHYIRYIKYAHKDASYRNSEYHRLRCVKELKSRSGWVEHFFFRSSSLARDWVEHGFGNNFHPRNFPAVENINRVGTIWEVWNAIRDRYVFVRIKQPKSVYLFTIQRISFK